MPFLLELAKKVCADESTALHDHMIILPTRRAKLYLESHFKDLLRPPAFLPKALTIEEFVKDVYPKRILDSQELLIHLFRSWKQIDPEAEMDGFLEFGPMLLRDFDHIDSNLVDAKEVFEQLYAEASIERWSEDLGRSLSIETPLVKRQFDFWEKVGRCYPIFKSTLRENGWATNGDARRELQENLDKYSKFFKDRKMLIAGFNSLSKAERGILFGLRDRFGAELIWDSKREYIDDIDNEAGRYLREYERPPDFIKPLNPDRFAREQEISIIGSQGLVAQSRLAWMRLEKWISEADFSQMKSSNNWMAIVLSDERMLFPLLESIPETLEDKKGNKVRVAEVLNITMGLTFDQSSLRSLLNQLFQILDKGSESIYFKDLLRILTNPLFSSSKEYSAQIATLQSKINSEKIIKVVPSDISDFDPDGKLKALFFPELRWDGKSLKTYLENLLNDWFESGTEDLAKDISKYFLIKAISVAEKMEKQFEGVKMETGFKTLSHFFFRSMDSFTIPFSSQPLKPIHIMGFLETRALDFQNVIVLSCNEGIIPRGRTFNSLLPHFASKVFDLPTFEDLDAASAYSFFRLLNEPSRVDLIYSKESDEMYRAEPSRYILQIENFWQGREGKNIKSLFQEFDLRTVVKEGQPGFEKTPEIQERIRHFLKGSKEYNKRSLGLSPSALINYVRDPMSFFQSNILEVFDQLVDEAEIDPMTLGTIIHGFLENALKPFKERAVDHSALSAMLNNEKALEKAFDPVIKRYSSAYSQTHGYSMIQLDIARELATEYLKELVQRNEKIVLYGLEKRLRATIQIKTKNHGKVEVLLKGMVDRIDRLESGYRILDYKSGSKRSGELSAKSMEDLLMDGGKPKIIQLLIYKYLFYKELKETKQEGGVFDFNTDEPEVQAGIYFFGGASKPLETYRVEDLPEDKEGFMDYVEKLLGLVIDQMLDPEFPLYNGPAFLKEDFNLK